VKHQNHESSVRPLGQHTPTIGKGVFIDRSAVVIGDVVIGDESSVWPLTVIRGDMHSIRIGARTSIQDSTVCHITHASHLHSQWPAVRVEMAGH
jgi:carbonic anhydrase/acetyltransferase-like protein (isoleucine patch superfamily)